MKIPKVKRDEAEPKPPHKNINRRHLLKFLGGSALGTLLTPLPWKVLDDVSIWTQNWSWIPIPPKGETVIRHTTCSLCPAGCGVRVRCIGQQPVSLTGLPGHPASRGSLCPAGLVGHHLPYHPERVTHPLRLVAGPGARETASLPVEELFTVLGDALAGIKSDSSQGRVAILDTLPGRSASLAYRMFLSRFTNGTYIAPFDDIQSSLALFRGVAGTGYPEFGFDLDHTQTIVSFGADLMEGWGTPGRVYGIRESSRTGTRLIQIEARYSKTAAMADSWLPIRPGTEPILALSLASVILKERLFHPGVTSPVEDIQAIPDAQALLGYFTPDRAAEACGIGADTIMATAREIGKRVPCVALIGGDQVGGRFQEAEHLSVNLLNLLTGAVGREGGLLPRRELPPPETEMADAVPATDLAEVPDGSVRFLIIDGTSLRHSIPSSLIQKKLAKKSLVVSFSPFQTGYAAISDYVLPAPFYLESMEEVPTASDSPVASFALSLPLLPPPPGTLSPLECLNRLAHQAGLEWPSLAGDTLTDSRIKAIWESRRGSVYGYSDGAVKANTEFPSPEELAKAFRDGAYWYDSAAGPSDMKISESPYLKADTWGRLKTAVDQRIEVARSAGAHPVTLMPFSTPFMATLASPLTGKLTRESNLYPQPGEAFISPSTASRLAMREGQRAEIETIKGRLAVCIRVDEAAMPDLVFVPVLESQVSPALPDPRNFCEIGEDGAWRGTPAKLRRLDV